jgi:hypothetical protein
VTLTRAKGAAKGAESLGKGTVGAAGNLVTCTLATPPLIWAKARVARPRMSESAQDARLIAEVVLLVSTTVMPALPANAQKSAPPASKSYIVCWAANLNAGFHTDNEGVGRFQLKYYSNIFTGQSSQSQQTTIQNAFTKYLLQTYPKDNTGPGRCGFYGSDGCGSRLA